MPFTVCQSRVCISPLKHPDYASCCLSRVDQWCCRVGALFPLQTHFASRMKYSSYLWVLEFFLFVCFLPFPVGLHFFLSRYPNLTLLLRLWLWPSDWASYPGSNLFVKHHQEDLPKTELSSQHSNNCWILPCSLHPQHGSKLPQPHPSLCSSLLTQQPPLLASSYPRTSGGPEIWWLPDFRKPLCLVHPRGPTWTIFSHLLYTFQSLSVVISSLLLNTALKEKKQLNPSSLLTPLNTS